MFRQQVKWSSCEEDYLINHREAPVMQLCGYLGKTRAALKRKLDEFDGKVVPSAKKSGKRTNIGKRADLDGLFMRSSWEANLARWLTTSGYSWEYEPEVFVFDGIKHGTVSYCPDFKIHIFGKRAYQWVEVKGQLKPSDKTRLRRMKKHHPAEFAKIVCVVGSPKTVAAKFFASMDIPVLHYYNELNKDCKSVIPHWE